MTMTANITSVVETITPERAAVLLEKNPNWRKLRPTRVVRYASAMKRGEWRMTGEAIKIKDNGDLGDGQHRLAACVETRVPFETLVVYGVTEDAVDYMDDVLPRHSGDILRNHGVKYENQMRAIAKRIIDWREGNFANGLRMATVTPQQIVDFVLINEDDLTTAMGIGVAMYSGTGVNRTMAASFAYLAGTVDVKARDEFCDSFATGAGLQIGDPILALRQWVVNRNVKKMKTKDEEVARVFIKTWNLWRSGESIERIKGDTLYKKKRGDNRPGMPDLI